MGVAAISAVLAALLIGFLAGLLAFKVKQRWCPLRFAHHRPGA